MNSVYGAEHSVDYKLRITINGFEWLKRCKSFCSARA